MEPAGVAPRLELTQDVRHVSKRGKSDEANGFARGIMPLFMREIKTDNELGMDMLRDRIITLMDVW
jgi:hypothetical protein